MLHTYTCSPRPGDAHIDTPCTPRIIYKLLRKHTLSFVTRPRAWQCIFLQNGVAKRNFRANKVWKLKSSHLNCYILQGERCVPAGAACSLAALAWATVSVTNQKHQETEMGHVCQFVWWHRTHPIIFVAHPEHKSPWMVGRFSPTIRGLFILPMMHWCVEWRQPQKRRGCRQPETNTCTPLLVYVCVGMRVCLNSCESAWLVGRVFKSRN